MRLVQRCAVDRELDAFEDQPQHLSGVRRAHSAERTSFRVLVEARQEDVADTQKSNGLANSLGLFQSVVERIHVALNGRAGAAHVRPQRVRIRDLILETERIEAHRVGGGIVVVCIGLIAPYHDWDAAAVVHVGLGYEVECKLVRAAGNAGNASAIDIGGRVVVDHQAVHASDDFRGAAAVVHVRVSVVAELPLVRAPQDDWLAAVDAYPRRPAVVDGRLVRHVASRAGEDWRYKTDAVRIVRVDQRAGGAWVGGRRVRSAASGRHARAIIPCCRCVEVGSDRVRAAGDVWYARWVGPILRQVQEASDVGAVGAVDSVGVGQRVEVQRGPVGAPQHNRDAGSVLLIVARVEVKGHRIHAARNARQVIRGRLPARRAGVLRTVLQARRECAVWDRVQPCLRSCVVSAYLRSVLVDPELDRH